MYAHEIGDLLLQMGRGQKYTSAIEEVEKNKEEEEEAVEQEEEAVVEKEEVVEEEKGAYLPFWW